MANAFKSGWAELPLNRKTTHVLLAYMIITMTADCSAIATSNAPMDLPGYKLSASALSNIVAN